MSRISGNRQMLIYYNNMGSVGGQRSKIYNNKFSTDYLVKCCFITTIWGVSEVRDRRFIIISFRRITWSNVVLLQQYGGFD